MTRKRLRFMNVNDENLLSRDEMKSVLAGSGSGDNCMGVEHYCNGAQIIFTQNANDWGYLLCISGGCCEFFEGTGQYGGTFCNGHNPCEGGWHN